MELEPYVESVRGGVTNAVSLADEHTQRIADQLGTAIDSATRLALLRALTDAAAEITTELAPGSVEVRMQGNDPAFVVMAAQGDEGETTLLMPEEPTPEPLTVDDDEGQARISLRLPQSVKERVDEHADDEGISTNTWLVRRIVEALSERTSPGAGLAGTIAQYTNQVVRSALTFPGSGAMALSGPPTPPAPPSWPSDHPRARNDSSPATETTGSATEASTPMATNPMSSGPMTTKGTGSVKGWVQ